MRDDVLPIPRGKAVSKNIGRVSRTRERLARHAAPGRTNTASMAARPLMRIEPALAADHNQISVIDQKVKRSNEL